MKTKKTVTLQPIMPVIKSGLIFLGFLLSSIYCFSQGVAINSSGVTADNSAILDVKSTTQGALIPRMTQFERNAISSPATSLLIYQTDKFQTPNSQLQTDYNIRIKKLEEMMGVKAEK